MLSSLFFTLLGLLFLVLGGEILLRGSVKLAAFFKLSPAVIGLTVVAAGTSVPELAVSAVAAWQGQVDIAVGNVVGSNIFNITFILGAVAIFWPLKITGNSIKLEYPVMLLVTFLFFNFARDGYIGRLDGLIFVLIYICFTAYLIRVVGKEITVEEKAEFEGEVAELKSDKVQTVWPAVLLTICGVVILTFAADLTVSSAVELGRLFGLTERIIGLTIVSAGTGLPEVVTSFVSSYRGRNDIAVANVIGSNIFNILIILGLTSLVSPLQVAQGIISSDNWWVLIVTVALFPIMRS